MNVLALTKYGPLGASSRVRTLQYVPHLEAAGLDVTVRPLLDDGYLARRYAGQGSGLPFLLRTYLARITEALRARRYDLVWIEKELMPWVPGLVERGLLAGTPYVLDYDDAIFHTYDRHPNPLVRRLMGRKIDRLMRGAALVVAGNDYLAERARSAGAERVEVVPSVIDLARYGPVTPPPEGPFTIGWIGSPGSERLLEHVRDVLAEAVREPDTRLVLVGASERALPGVPHETWAWSEDGGGRADAPVPRRHHAAGGYAVGARQVRVQAHPVHGGGPCGSGLAGRCQCRDRGGGRNGFSAPRPQTRGGRRLRRCEPTGSGRRAWEWRGVVSSSSGTTSP